MGGHHGDFEMVGDAVLIQYFGEDRLPSSWDYDLPSREVVVLLCSTASVTASTVQDGRRSACNGVVQTLFFRRGSFI